MKYRSTLITLFLWIFLVVLSYPLMQKHSQSFIFVDEAEHLVMAWLMDQGYELYTDFPNNHQPINYLISYTIQQLDPVANVYMLVSRHRQAIFVFSMIWTLILAIRFGYQVLLPIGMFEIVKYLLLGNLFLAESLIAYPLGYLFLDLLYKNTARQTRLEHYVAGLIAAFIQLTLLPMAVVNLVLALLRFFFGGMQAVKYYVFGIVTVLLLVFLFVNPINYVVEMHNALKYSLPGLTPIEHWWDNFRLVGLPMIYATQLYDVFGQLVIGIILCLLISGYLLFKKTNVSKKKILFFGLIFAWLVTNTRKTDANNFYYQGFHLIPWIFIGLLLAIVNLEQHIRSFPKKRLIQLVLGITLLAFLTRKDLPIYATVDPETEHYVQYTPLVDAAKPINELKQQNDRLMVIPNKSYIYFMTGLLPADTNMFTFYDWQLEVPKNRQMFFDTLEHDPPEFIVYEDDGSSYSPFMNEYLKENYIELRQFIHVYIHDSLTSRLNSTDYEGLLDEN